MSWEGKAYVTAANPAPGQMRVPEGVGPDKSGNLPLVPDNGVGLNVYIAGGAGPSGVLPVSQTNPVNISLSGVTIGGIIEVTTTLGHPLQVTGSVFVENFPPSQALVVTSSVPVTGSVSVANLPATQSVFVVNQGTSSFAGDVNITGSITLPVSQTNPVLTSSVNVLNWPVTASVQAVTGTVAVSNLSVTQTVSGTVALSGPVAITGVLTATLTGALSATILNLPATQSVFVVNQSSSSLGTVSISGVSPVSGFLPVTGTVTVQGISFSGSFSGASDVNINGTTVSNNYSIPFPATSQVILAANSNRKSFAIFNDTNQNILVRFGPTASLTSWTFNLYPQYFYEPTTQVWKGDISSIGVGPGSGSIQVEEMFL